MDKPRIDHDTARLLEEAGELIIGGRLVKAPAKPKTSRTKKTKEER